MSSPLANKTENSQYKLSKEIIKKIKTLSLHFPEKKSALIPALQAIQDEFGWLPDAAIRQLAELLNIAPNKIYGVATFYSMFKLAPVGKYHIQICRNVSCQLMGAKNIIDHLSKKLKIKPGETTKDERYTITLVECLGSCSAAPVMMINDKYYENLNADKVDDILKRLP